MPIDLKFPARYQPLTAPVVNRATASSSPAKIASSQQVLQLKPRSNRFKHLEGQSVGNAIRMLTGDVTASGMLTYQGSAPIMRTGKSGDSNAWLGRNADDAWEDNRRKVSILKRGPRGHEIAEPSKDAEISVLYKLRVVITENGWENRRDGALQMSANGTTICKYCRRVIRAFCRDYNLRWTNDPMNG